METFKNFCCLIVVGWMILQVVAYFKPEPPKVVVEHERVTQIIMGDPSGGPDIILWPVEEK